MILKEVEGFLSRLKFMRDEGKKIAISRIKELGKSQEDPTARVDEFLEFVTILPEQMDPAGIVWKLEHLIDVREDRFKNEVRIIAPQADETQLNNLEFTLGVALSLNFVYKVIRHLYLLSKKTLSLYTIVQVQMVLPLLMRQVEALSNALRAFSQGQPIGDGAGALVAARLMYGQQKERISKDMIRAKLPMEGRTAHVLKAEGPGANLGKPGEAIKQIIEENKGKIASLIVVDAGSKLEGEKVGAVAGGVGVAIGGPGVERFKVEEIALKYKIPVHAIIVKEDIGDAYSHMRKEIYDSVDDVLRRIRRLILERTREGDSVIIAGIGNTIGIAQ
jgi:hypothetical protein